MKRSLIFFSLIHTSQNEIDDVDILSKINYHILLFVYDISVNKQVFTEQKTVSESNSKKSSSESSSGSKKDLLYPTVVGNNFNDFYIPPVYEVFDDPLDLPMPVTFQSSTGKLCDPMLGKEPATTIENGIAPEPVTKNSRETPILCPPPKIIGPQKARVMQYIELPHDLRHCKITSITPSVDGRFILLTAEDNSLDVNINHVATNGVDPDELKIVDSGVEDMCSKKIVQDNFVWGALLLFRISSNADGITLDTQPTQKAYIHNKLKIVTSVLMLPLDVRGSYDDDDYSNHLFNSDSDECGAFGHLCVTTFDGCLEILELCSLRILNEHEAPLLARFVSMSYCSGK